jgi:hypothetical protein
MSLIKDIEGFFNKVFKSTTTAQKVLATAGALAPLVEAGLSFSGDPAAAAVVSQALTTAQTDLGTFTSIVQQSGTSPTALSVLNPGLSVLPDPNSSRAGAKSAMHAILLASQQAWQQNSKLEARSRFHAAFSVTLSFVLGSRAFVDSAHHPRPAPCSSSPELLLRRRNDRSNDPGTGLVFRGF